LKKKRRRIGFFLVGAELISVSSFCEEEEEVVLVVLVVAAAAAAAAVVAMVLAPAFVFQGIGHYFPGFQGM
jgi:hypothetical protein